VTAAPRLSVVIPAFNEAHRLPPYLHEVVGFLEGRGEPWEVIVVDDGSTDGTAAVVRELAEHQPGLRLLPFGRNRGKGAAVRAGMLAARGALRLFTDADGATPIAELKRLEAALKPGIDVVIGSRALPAPAVAVRARRHRVAAGRVFNWLVARLGLRGVADSQCGFKLFTAGAADALFEALQTAGFAFDVELLLRAQKAGYGVVEVAVNWADQKGGKVGLLTSGPGMLVEVGRARWRVGRP
jgi:dolichyl-phosphate beta-glucosyltransferase